MTAAGEPTAVDLAAIEAEWPLIEAELAVLDAEVRMLTAAGGPSPVDWRRLRRAERRVLDTALRVVRGEAERRAWVLAARNTETELEAWNRLYDALMALAGSPRGY